MIVNAVIRGTARRVLHELVPALQWVGFLGLGGILVWGGSQPRSCSELINRYASEDGKGGGGGEGD